MKRFSFFSKTAFCFLLFTSLLFSQSNSIELQDGGGVLISSHESVQSAYNAIPATITQAYIIEIQSSYTGSTETYPIIFSNRIGSSAANTIKIMPASGNTGEVISGTASGSGGVPIILFDNCEFVILDGRPGGAGADPDLKIQNFSTAGNSYTIELTNGASNNIVRYVNTINGSAGTAGGRNIAIDATPSASNSNNLITNCIIDGGRSAIGLISTGTGAMPNDKNSIVNCVIKNFGYAGIWFLGVSSNTTVSGCEIFQETSSTSTIMSGISINSSASGGNNIFEGNKIYNIRSTSSATGFSPRGITVASAAAGSTLRIVNNFISLPENNNNGATAYGIYLAGSSDYNVDLLYNTIFIGGIHTGGTSGNVVTAGIYKVSTSDTAFYTQKNNICVNIRSGGNSGVFHVGSFIGNAAGTPDIDYNNYYASGDPGSYSAGWLTTVYNDLAQYKTAASPHEQNSVFHPVNFVSSTDLHLTGSSVGDVTLTGTPLGDVTTDIDGQTRHASTPYMGADEGDIPLPVELAGFTASVDINNVTLHWTTVSEQNNLGFDIERAYADAEWEKAGFVPGKGTTTEISSYQFVDENLSAGKYNYRIKQIDFNGSYSYYNLENEVEVNIPLEFDLAQNFPNPFNPTTLIKYSIASPVNVVLKVYDVLGKEAAVLVNERKEAGSYEIEFSAKSFGSGVYFYTIEAGNYKSAKKMMILK